MCVLVLAARMRPRFALRSCPREIRGRREGRVPAGTRGPCAEEVHRANHRYSRDIPALPARMVLTAYSVLLATNSSCHRHRRIEWRCPIRLDRKHLRRLDTSNGCQDHTALPSATAPFVLRAPIAHETWKSPPCDRSTRAALSRPPHPRPNVRDDRDTPLCAGRDGGNKQLIWGNHEADSFFARDWTAQISLKGSGKLDFSRRGGTKFDLPFLAWPERSRHWLRSQQRSRRRYRRDRGAAADAPLLRWSTDGCC